MFNYKANPKLTNALRQEGIVWEVHGCLAGYIARKREKKKRHGACSQKL